MTTYYQIVADSHLIGCHETLELAQDFAKQYSSHGTMMPVHIFDSIGRYVSTHIDGVEVC